VNIDEIETFLCIVELGSFSSAAIKLHRSQPAISRRIQLLEQSLEADLFEREGKKATLTQVGQTFLPYAQAVLASIRDGERAVAAYKQNENAASSLHFGIVGTLADSYLVEAMRQFKLLEPSVSLSIRTATSREVSDLVRSGEVELGIRYFSGSDSKLSCDYLGSEKLQVVVAASHPITAKRLPNLQPLAAENWLSFSKGHRQPESFGQLLERELMASGLSDTRITVIDSLTAQKRLVQAGFGVTLMPMSSIQEELRAGSLRVINIDDLKAELPVYVIKRKSGYQNSVGDRFIAELKKAMTFLN